MKKNIRFVVAGLLMATMALAPVVGMAQDKPKAPAAGSTPDKPATANARPAPFRGTVAAVDKNAKTVTVGERTFHISSETRLMKGNQPATVADINVGDAISGNFIKGDDGTLTAKMIRFGPRPSQAEKKETMPVEKKKNDNAAE